MKKLAINIFAILITAFCSAQTGNLAETAPKGILIFLGTKIPNGVKVQSIKLQKKTGTGDFKSLAEIKSPATEQEFLTRVNENKKYFMGNSTKNRFLNENTESSNDEKIKYINLNIIILLVYV